MLKKETLKSLQQIYTMPSFRIVSMRRDNEDSNPLHNTPKTWELRVENSVWKGEISYKQNPTLGLQIFLNARQYSTEAYTKKAAWQYCKKHHSFAITM